MAIQSQQPSSGLSGQCFGQSISAARELKKDWSTLLNPLRVLLLFLDTHTRKKKKNPTWYKFSWPHFFHRGFFDRVFFKAVIGLGFFSVIKNIHAQASKQASPARALAAESHSAFFSHLIEDLSHFGRQPLEHERSTLSEPQSRFGDKPLIFQVGLPPKRDRIFSKRIRQATATRSRRWLGTCHPPLPTIKCGGSAR